jgi:hypothetical protein
MGQTDSNSMLYSRLCQQHRLVQENGTNNTFTVSLIIPKLCFTMAYFCAYLMHDCIVFVGSSVSQAIEYKAKTCLSPLQKFSLLRPNCLIRWRLADFVCVLAYFTYFEK